MLTVVLAWCNPKDFHPTPLLSCKAAVWLNNATLSDVDIARKYLDKNMADYPVRRVFVYPDTETNPLTKAKKQLLATIAPIHLQKTQGGTMCGKEGMEDPDINFVTCSQCLLAHAEEVDRWEAKRSNT